MVRGKAEQKPATCCAAKPSKNPQHSARQSQAKTRSMLRGKAKQKPAA
jgi:hypothetical protein